MNTNLIRRVLFVYFMYAPFGVHGQMPDLDYEEGECVPTTYDRSLDPSWFGKESNWHIVLANKNYIHQVLLNVYWKPVELITLPEMKRSCVRLHKFNLGEKKVAMDAFGRIGYYENFGSDDTGSFSFRELKNDQPIGPKAYGNITYTDNKTFVVFIICFDNGQRAFALASKTTSLAEDVLEQIEKYAEKMGFNPKYMIRLSFDNCLIVDADNNIEPSNNSTSSSYEPARQVRQSNRLRYRYRDRGFRRQERRHFDSS